MKTQTAFTPMLVIGNGITDISFYANAFGAVEQQRWSNDDGTVHVAELTIDGAMFHIHEETKSLRGLSPLGNGRVTAIMGLMVDDVHAVYDRAIAAGAKVMSPVQDFGYGYRQGDLQDPFGHQWTIQKKI